MGWIFNYYINKTQIEALVVARQKVNEKAEDALQSVGQLTVCQQKIL